MFKFSCEKALLSSGIGTVSRTVASKSTIPALEGILVQVGEKIMLTGYNLETGIRTAVSGIIEEMGSAVLDARLFGEIIRRMPDDMITLTCDEKLNVTIESGMSKFSIMAIDAADYPKLNTVEEDDGITVKQNILKSMIGETIFAVSDNQARPVHTGSLFDVDGSNLTIVSVDGYRLAMRKEKISDKDLGVSSFVVPGVALTEVERICQDKDEDVLIRKDSKYVVFNIGDTVLVSRRLEGDFLNYKKAIPRNNPVFVIVDKKSMISSIERVALIISDKVKTPVRFKFEDGVVNLNTHGTIGTASHTCAITGDGGGLEIGFNDKYILDAVKNASAESIKIELNTSISPAIIVPAEGEEKFVYMVLPVRLK